MNPTPLLVYTPKLTSRIDYTISLFFGTLMKTEYRITTDVEEYKVYEGPRLNYSDKPIATNEVFIGYTGLLQQIGITTQRIEVKEWEGTKIFYPCEGALPFDVFSAAFYLVTRYEEYLPVESDIHKRFRPTDSLAVIHKFIDTPLVNLWANKLKAVLVQKFPSIQIIENKYTYVPTIDIDVAYEHKGRKAYVTLGSYFKAIIGLNVSFIVDKTKTLMGLKEDDYDTYSYQKEVFSKAGVKPIYFFLSGRKRGPYDRNVDISSKEFIDLVKAIGSHSGVGIHPSYQSLDNKAMIRDEISGLSEILGKRITSSRQHYLRFRLPQTYRYLAAGGITDDYSMGYAACPGFRASICTPYFFFDVLTEEQLPIKLHPSIVMDGTLNGYINVTPDEAIVLTKSLIDKVKKYNGEFVNIWHNDTLSDIGVWKGWKRVFESNVEAAK